MSDKLNILHINTCFRKNSRTLKISSKLLNKLDGEIKTLDLEKEKLKPLNNKRLEKRTKLIEKGDFSNKIFGYAKEFANADIIVISTPFYDLSFSALLKTYIENVCVSNLTFGFDEKGKMEKKIKAKALYYVSTSGGAFIKDFGFNYIEGLAKNMFLIEKVELLYAEMLDIVGSNEDKILSETLKKYDLE